MDPAYRQLGADVLLGAVVRHIGPLPVLRPGRRPFVALCSAIASQQLSVKAAATIWGRVQALVPDLEPAALALVPAERLRACGLSARKATYIRDLAAAVACGRVCLDHLAELDAAVLTERLVGLRGLGPWSVEMFRIFELAEPDVFSPGDLGLRRALCQLSGLDEWNYPVWCWSVAEPWRPYRSLACRYLWRSLDNAPPLPG